MKYLVHVGYPKAASTWLQTFFFPGKDKRIRPLMKRGQQSSGNYNKSGGQLFYSPELPLLDEQLSKYVYPYFFDTKGAIKELQKATDPDAMVTVISNEAWAGHPFSGGVTYYEYASRIKSVVPQAKILIVVRRQEDMILSVYAHFMRVCGGRCNLKKFLTARFHNQMPWHNPLYYCYHILVNEYVKLFGRKNILVLPAELLSRGRQHEFVGSIYRFLDMAPVDLEGLDCPANVRNYKEYVLVSRIRFLNKLAHPHPANGNVSVKIPFLREVLIALGTMVLPRAVEGAALRKDRALIKQYFAPYAAYTNQRLQEFVDFDLKTLGYSF